MTDQERMNQHGYFIEQKNSFVTAIKESNVDVVWTLDWATISAENPGNWFIMFKPATWCCQGFSGVHYTFGWVRPLKSREAGIRLAVGVEKPLRDQWKESFKQDVVAAIEREGTPLPSRSELWPNAGMRRGTKLFETHVDATPTAYIEMAAKYESLAALNGVISNMLHKYEAKGAFSSSF